MDSLKVAFFTQEESGMAGSNEISQEWLSDCGYIIQLDRWGRSDFICVNGKEKTVSEEFLQRALPVMNAYGYLEQEGLITDSINLWNQEVGVSCVNVSCGYYQHHTDKEKIDLNEAWNSLLFTEDLILTLGEDIYPSEPSYKVSYVKGYNWRDSDYGYGYRSGYSWNEWDAPDTKTVTKKEEEEENLDVDMAFYILEQIAEEYQMNYSAMSLNVTHTHWDFLVKQFNTVADSWGCLPEGRAYIRKVLSQYVEKQKKLASQLPF